MFSYLLKTVILQSLAQFLLPSPPDHLHSESTEDEYFILHQIKRQTYKRAQEKAGSNLRFSGGFFRGCSSDSAAAAAASGNKQLIIIILVHASYFVSICCVHRVQSATLRRGSQPLPPRLTQYALPWWHRRRNKVKIQEHGQLQEHGQEQVHGN